MTPHTASPAPNAITNVCNTPMAELKKSMIIHKIIADNRNIIVQYEQKRRKCSRAKRELLYLAKKAIINSFLNYLVPFFVGMDDLSGSGGNAA